MADAILSLSGAAAGRWLEQGGSPTGTTTLATGPETGPVTGHRSGPLVALGPALQTRPETEPVTLAAVTSRTAVENGHRIESASAQTPVQKTRREAEPVRTRAPGCSSEPGRWAPRVQARGPQTCVHAQTLEWSKLAPSTAAWRPGAV